MHLEQDSQASLPAEWTLWYGKTGRNEKKKKKFKQHNIQSLVGAVEKN